MCRGTDTQGRALLHYLPPKRATHLHNTDQEQRGTMGLHPGNFPTNYATLATHIGRVPSMCPPWTSTIYWTRSRTGRRKSPRDPEGDCLSQEECPAHGATPIAYLLRCSSTLKVSLIGKDISTYSIFLQIPGPAVTNFCHVYPEIWSFASKMLWTCLKLRIKLNNALSGLNMLGSMGQYIL